MRSSNAPAKLFVGDIGSNRKSDLDGLFSKYGEISTIYLDDNKHFAFVQFISSSDAQRALQRTNNKTLNGSRLRVEYAKPDKPFRNNRSPLSREHSRPSAVYDHLQVTANRLPSMPTLPQSYYQHHPATMMTNSTLSSRGRSLTPPSFKQNPRLSSMNHLPPQDLYSPYYPHPALYTDPAYYRTYGDPYLMQRIPPPPPPFLPPTSPPPSSSSRAYRNMHSSSDFDRYPSSMSHRRKKRSRSRSRRRSPTSRRNRSNREKKRKRRTSSSPQKRERGSPSSHRTKKRSRSSSKTTASTSEQDSSSTSSSEDGDKHSNSRKSQDNESNQKHSKTKTKE